MAKIQYKGRRRLLPLDLWPEADRKAWAAACRPAARLRPGGRAGHLRPVTRDSHAEHYSYFLGFLDRRGLLERNQPAAANVTAQNIAAYIDHIKGHIASTTLYSSICRIRRTAQYMVPDRDFAWLAEIDKELKLVAHPRPRRA
jgi:hypothetical protein